MPRERPALPACTAMPMAPVPKEPAVSDAPRKKGGYHWCRKGCPLSPRRLRRSLALLAPL
eukprot:1847944-Prorocentrum_lima.AAC.1